MRRELRTEFLGMEMSSPLVLPAGVLDISFSSLRLAIENGAGLVTSKSLTKEPRKGHEGPVVAEVESGLLNCMGLCNPGIKEGLEELALFREHSEAPVNVSVFSTAAEGFEELALAVNSSEADFLELNLSCPNVMDEFGIPLAASQKAAGEIVSRVKSVSRLPVIAKLSPNVTGFTGIAGAAVEAGADALCMINTLGSRYGNRYRNRKPGTLQYNRRAFGTLYKIHRSAACIRKQKGGYHLSHHRNGRDNHRRGRRCHDHGRG